MLSTSPSSLCMLFPAVALRWNMLGSRHQQLYTLKATSSLSLSARTSWELVWYNDDNVIVRCMYINSWISVASDTLFVFRLSLHCWLSCIPYRRRNTCKRSRAGHARVNHSAQLLLAGASLLSLAQQNLGTRMCSCRRALPCVRSWFCTLYASLLI